MESGSHFDSSRAELFEALGHPARVKILRTLEERPMGFAELKREVGIESSGHLQFHLGKLTGLVTTNAEGSYTLTDDGREAIRVLNLTEKGLEEIAPTAKAVPVRKANWTIPLLACLLVAVVVLGAVAAYQQQQIASLSSGPFASTTMFGGTKYYYEAIPSYAPNGTSITFHGVTFTYLEEPTISYSNPANYTAQGSVRLSNGTLLDLAGKTVRVAEAGFAINFPGGNVTGVRYGTVMTTGIAIRFQDNSREIYNGYNLTASSPGSTIWLTFTWQPNLANPWFGQHKNPQAGVAWDYLSSQNDLVILVSASN